MRNLRMNQAISLALAEEMKEDPRVVVFGEDVAVAEGPFKTSEGLLEAFGPLRVRDTPISETGFLGAAVGAAVTGLRPVTEIMFAEFLGVAFDQLVTEAATMHYLSGTRLSVPLTVRASSGAGLGFGCQHSQSLERWFIGTPGLKLGVASGPRSAYGLIKAAIRDDNPVVILEPRILYGRRERFTPDAAAVIPLGHGEIRRQGTDVTVVAVGQTVGTALEAAEQAASWSAEVIDLRTLMPWDQDLVAASVARTGRLVTIEENQYTGGWGAHVAAFIAAESFRSLREPVTRITAPDVHVPYGLELEQRFLPSAAYAATQIDTLLRTRGAARTLVGGKMTSPGTHADGRKEPDPAILRREALIADRIAPFQRMVEIRLVEDKVMELFADGHIAGTTHTGQGQEAVAVGLAGALRSMDFVMCTYRGHGIALALGVPPAAVLGEILGRRVGCMGGLGGSMHLSDPSVGLLPTSAIVGAGLPIAVGAALTAQVLGEDRVAAAVFGDGQPTSAHFMRH